MPPNYLEARFVFSLFVAVTQFSCAIKKPFISIEKFWGVEANFVVSDSSFKKECCKKALYDKKCICCNSTKNCWNSHLVQLLRHALQIRSVFCCAPALFQPS